MKFRTISLDNDLEDEDDVRIWIIDHQDGRRELAPYTIAVLQIEKNDIKRRRNNQHTKGELMNIKDCINPAVQYCTAAEEVFLYKQAAKNGGVGTTAC